MYVIYTKLVKYVYLLVVSVDIGFHISSCSSRGFKDLELDTPSIEKRFAYSFLQQLIRYVDEAHQYILEFGGYPSCCWRPQHQGAEEHRPSVACSRIACTLSIRPGTDRSLTL